ncbi:restriction endonuclease subunit S [Tabrizicola sp. WMC-M-20]|nr:restriction endonuclease subunit S [Tabrizicola sp. WMC-M-20]
MGGEWIDTTIGEMGTVKGGATPSTSDAANFDGDVPWLTPKDLSGNHSRWVDRGARNLSDRGFRSCSANLLPARAVLLSSRAPVGYVALARTAITTNQGFRSIIVNPEHSPEYVYYWLKANTEKLEQHATGSTFKELSGNALKAIKLRVPRLDEQLAIAELLGSLDDKVELNRRTAATLEEMGRALFKSWFVDFDPVRAKVGGRHSGLSSATSDLFPESFGEDGIPLGWSIGPVADIVEVNPSQYLKAGTTTPYVDMAALPTKGPCISGYIMRDASSGSRFQLGDTLVARITPCLENGKTALVDFLEAGVVAWGSTEFIVLRPRAPMSRTWPYLLARDEAFRAHLIAAMTGSSGRQRVPQSSVAAWEMALPPPTVLAAFAAAADPLFERISALNAEVATLVDLRDTLLPKLISGEVRIKDAGNGVEAA